MQEELSMSFNYFRMTATDSYNFIYFVDGDEKALDKLKDPLVLKCKEQELDHYGNE